MTSLQFSEVDYVKFKECLFKKLDHWLNMFGTSEMSCIVLSIGQAKFSLTGIAGFTVKLKQKRRWVQSPNLTIVGCFFVGLKTSFASSGIFLSLKVFVKF